MVNSVYSLETAKNRGITRFAAKFCCVPSIGAAGFGRFGAKNPKLRADTRSRRSKVDAVHSDRGARSAAEALLAEAQDDDRAGGGERARVHARNRRDRGARRTADSQ